MKSLVVFLSDDRGLNRSLLLFILILLLFIVHSATAATEAGRNVAPPDTTAVSWIYWTDIADGEIHRAHLDTSCSGQQSLVSDPIVERPRGIVLDAAANHMYWVDRNTGQILRASLTGSGLSVIKSGLFNPDGLALDLNQNMMYWTEPGYPRIARGSLDGPDTQTLYGASHGMSSMVGIALDVAAGKMYWAEYQPGRIMRGNMDGSGIPEELVTDQWGPLEITLDLNASMMYWTDVNGTSNTGRIQAATLDGENVYTLPISGLQNPRGIALDSSIGQIYWADWGTDRIQRANLNGSGVVTLCSGTADGVKDPRSIALLFSEPDCFALSRTHSGLGNDPLASSSPGCGSGEYRAGEIINLTATPADGWRVAGWSGTNNNISTSVTNTATMPASNHTVSVHYEPIPITCFSLTLTHTGSGADPSAAPNNSAGCLGGQYLAGTVIHLTASPSPGWRVAGWNGTDNNSSVSLNNTVTMPATGHTATVHYESIPPICYSLNRTHTGSGSDPTAEPPNSGGCSGGTYLAGTVITLTAAPETGWRVQGWSGTDNNSSSLETNTTTMPASNHTVSVAYGSVPITGLYLPLVSFTCYHSVGEQGPNNSIDQAFGPFCLGAIFFGLPDDKDDYLFFELNTETAVTIGLPVRPPTVQQLQLYRGSTSDLVKSIGGPPYTISCRLQPARYYVRVLAVEPFSTNSNYRLTLDAAAHAPFCD